MRAMMTILLILETAAVTASIALDGTVEGRLPESVLRRVRGGDPGSHRSAFFNCSELNLQSGQVSNLGCTEAGTVCVECEYEPEFGYRVTDDPLSEGPPMTYIGMQSCGGGKRFGVCRLLVPPPPGQSPHDDCVVDVPINNGACSGETTGYIEEPIVID